MADMTLNNATELARYNMIEQQVRPWDVSNPKVLEVMQNIAREQFVPEIHKKLAFADVEIPIGQGEKMMSPKLEGRLLQALDIQQDDEIFELGTGSGFVTACMAKLGKHVHSIEQHPELCEMAGQNLYEAEITNVSLYQSDATQEWTNEPAQFDVVALTASMPKYDERFECLLKPGGRLFAIVGEAPVMNAVLVKKSELGDVTREILFETSLPPIHGMEPPSSFTF